MFRPLLKILLLTISLVFLAGCASNKPGSSDKIGVHFDAVLEFVVEYPLSWQKDRRLPFGSTDGEVRWTHPGHPGVLLKIQSAVFDSQEISKDEAVARVSAEYPRLVPYQVDEIMLLGSKATLVTGNDRELEIQAYVLNINRRVFLIVLEKPGENQENFQNIMDRAINSFRVIPRT